MSWINIVGLVIVSIVFYIIGRMRERDKWETSTRDGGIHMIPTNDFQSKDGNVATWYKWYRIKEIERWPEEKE